MTDRNRTSTAYRCRRVMNSHALASPRCRSSLTFWYSDQVIVPAPGVESMMAAIMLMIRSGDVEVMCSLVEDGPTVQLANGRAKETGRDPWDQAD